MGERNNSEWVMKGSLDEPSNMSLADLLAEALAAYENGRKEDLAVATSSEITVSTSSVAESGSPRADDVLQVTGTLPALDPQKVVTPNAAYELANAIGVQPDSDGNVPLRAHLNRQPGLVQTNIMTRLITNAIRCGGQDRGGFFGIYGKIEEKQSSMDRLGVVAATREFAPNMHRTGVEIYTPDTSRTLLHVARLQYETDKGAHYKIWTEKHSDPDSLSCIPECEVAGSSSKEHPALIGELAFGLFCVTELYNQQRHAEQRPPAPNYAIPNYHRWLILEKLGLPVAFRGRPRQIVSAELEGLT